MVCVIYRVSQISIFEFDSDIEIGIFQSELHIVKGIVMNRNLCTDYLAAQILLIRKSKIGHIPCRNVGTPTRRCCIDLLTLRDLATIAPVSKTIDRSGGEAGRKRNQNNPLQCDRRVLQEVELVDT